MNRKRPEIRFSPSMSAVLAAALSIPAIAFSQVPVDEQGVPLTPVGAEVESIAGASAEAATLSSTELQDLVGPVALYPDDLLAIVLPASTYPLEIVQAARFLEELETDSSLQPDDAWDESVTALLNYPEVIQMMDEEIDWTWRLGEAVIAQQNELIAAIEEFRDRAYAAGNLKTDDYQTVSMEDGAIEIEPVDEEIIYVPYYEPAEVVVYQRRPAYYYYPRAYPVYYYPYPAGHRFTSRYFWGVTTAFTIGWNSHYLHVHHPSYWGHPYYGSSYYGHYYRRPSINIYNNWYVNNRRHNSRYRYRDGDYWRPRTRSGARPHEQRVRNFHYPSNNRDRSAYRENGNRTRVANNGRMDLRLRERDNARQGRSGSSRNTSATSVRTANRDINTQRRASSENARRERSRSDSNRRVSNDSARSTRVAQSSNRPGVSRNTNRAVNQGNVSRRSTGTSSRRDTVASNRRSISESSRRNSISTNRTTSRQATPPAQAERRTTSRREAATTSPRRTATNRTAAPRQPTQSSNRSRNAAASRVSRAPVQTRQTSNSSANRGKSNAAANRSSRSSASSNRRGNRRNN